MARGAVPEVVIFKLPSSPKNELVREMKIFMNLFCTGEDNTIY